MKKQDYLDNLDTFINDPESVGFTQDIIPVAMWLRGYMPSDDYMSACNKTSMEIRLLLCNIVEIDINSVSRLMVMNGYSIGGLSDSNPEWLMKRIDDAQ